MAATREDMQQKRGTVARWAAVNPILLKGEIGVEFQVDPSEPAKTKIGDGVTAWNDLPYQASGGGGGASDLNDLTDVTLTAPATGRYLRHNGTTFVDATISASDIPAIPSSVISDFNAAADARVALIVDAAPGTLNTLNELAAALGDDANFAATTAAALAAKASVSYVDTEISEGGAAGEMLPSAGWEAVIESLNSIGGRLQAPRGTLITTTGGVSVQDGSIIHGKGSTPDAVQGSVFEAGANNLNVFEVSSGQRDIFIRDLAIDCVGRTGCTGIKMAPGVDGLATFHIGYDNVTFRGGEYGVDIYDPLAQWQVTGVMFKDCYFNAQTLACFRNQTTNCRYYFLGCSFTPVGNADAIQLNGSATILIANSTFNGAVLDPKTYNFTFATTDVSAAGNSVTKAGTNAVTMDSGYLSSTGTLPAGLSTQIKYWLGVSGTTHTFHYSNREAGAGANAVDITDVGSGTHTWHSTALILTGRPTNCIKITGHNGTITMLNNEAEGFAHWLHVDGNFESQWPILMQNNSTQGNVLLKSDCEMISIANNYLADSFSDIAGVKAKVTSIGDKIYTPDGLGATYLGMSGHPVPKPARLSNFKGRSYITTEREYSFLPRDIEDCILELDVDAFRYYWADTNVINVNWPDYSPRNMAVVYNGTPYFVEAAHNGRPSIRTEAAGSEFFSVAGLDGYPAYHIISGVRHNTTTDGGNLWSASPDFAESLPYSNGLVYSNFGTNERKAGVTPLVALNTFHIEEFWSAPNDWAYVQNGQTVQTDATNVVSMASTIKFGYNNVNYQNEDVLFRFMFRRKLFYSERQKVFAYIKDRWGMDANLSGTNTGDQTSIVGITGTLAQFNTAITDGDIPVVSDVAYDATTWNANLDAPSKNAVRDKFESLSAGGLSQAQVLTRGLGC